MNIIQNLPILVVIVPLIASFCMPIIGLFRRRYCFYLTLITNFLILIFAMLLLNYVINQGEIHYYLGNWEPPYGIEYVIDHLSAFMIILISFIAFIMTIYSKEDVENELPTNAPLFYTLFMLLTASLLGIVSTGDLFNLYVFLEIASLSAYTLVAVGKKKDALIGSFNYLIMGTLGACFILIGIGFLYLVTGSLNMADIALRLPSLYSSHVVHAAAIFFVVGLSIKIALFPLHVWLPDAHAHAPSTISVFLSGLVLKVGAYAMIRVLFDIFTVEFFVNTLPIAEVLSWMAAIAIIAGSINAIAQKDIKRMLAYSSVSQMGYIALGIGLANTPGIMGSLLHILNHAFMKGCLFSAAGAIIHKYKIRNVHQFKGLGKKMPYTMAAFSIAAISMVGAPPFGAFFSKLFLALGAIESGKWIFALIILISSLLNAAYFFSILERAYFTKLHDEEIEEAPISMVLPTFILAMGCIAFGVFMFILEPFLRDIATSLL
ncbi:MAG: hypothetical protein DRO95_01470 [Candidatus Altiarchaeales archaeon]|nr:MAG: hypothetical protein DRO95_01470 [Candidatus Altiarchaeales archaeon]